MKWKFKKCSYKITELLVRKNFYCNEDDEFYFNADIKETLQFQLTIALQTL